MRLLRRISCVNGAVFMLIVCAVAFSITTPVVCAVQTSFSRFFTYERSNDLWGDDTAVVDIVNATKPTLTANNTTRKTNSTKKSTSGNPNAVRRETYNSVAAMLRWNTFTAVSSFGMEAGARVDLEITNLTYAAFPTYYSSKQVPVVFTLYDDDQWRAYSVLMLRDLPLKSPTILCHYPSAMRYTVTEKQFMRRTTGTTKTISVSFEVKKSSLYTLQVQVCGDVSVFVAGRASMVNRGYDNKLTEHLAVEELGLLALYKALIVIYSIFTFLWIVDGFMHRKTTSKLAHVFQMSLHMKTLEAFIKLWFYRELSLHGQRDTSFRIAQHIAESAASAVLMWVLLLAALGWSLTRDALSSRECRFMYLSFLFYFTIALVKATCVSDDDDICKAYMLTEYLIKSMMMLGVIVALNFTISQLRLALNEARWNHHVSPLMYMKLNQFQSFRYVFLAYLLVPTSLLILEIIVITPPGYWRYDWVNDLLHECSTLAIFVGVAINLRPIDLYIFSHISRGTITGGPSTIDAPPSPNSPIGGNVVVPQDATQDDIPGSEAEVAMESNRRLLLQYASSTSPPPSPPRSPPSPPSARHIHSPFSSPSIMMPPLGRRPM